MWTRALEWGAGGLVFFFSSACAFHWLQPVNLLHLSLRTKANPSPASSFPFSYYLIFTLLSSRNLKQGVRICCPYCLRPQIIFSLLQTSSPWLMRNHILHNHSFPLSCVGNSLSSCLLNISLPHCQLSSTSKISFILKVSTTTDKWMIFHLYLQPQASFKYFLILFILTSPKLNNNWIQAIIIS